MKKIYSEFCVWKVSLEGIYSRMLLFSSPKILHINDRHGQFLRLLNPYQKCELS